MGPFRWSAGVYLAIACGMLAAPCRGETVTLLTAGGGIAIGGGNPYTAGFGAVNALGIGTPAAGLTVLPATGGALYVTPYSIDLSALAAATVSMYVYVNPAYAHSSVLKLYSCTASCTTESNFTLIGTAASKTTVLSGITAPGGTYTAWLGLFVGYGNGSGTFSDTASLTFELWRTDQGPTLRVTKVLSLSSPATQVQSAVRLKLATAGGGRTVSTAADFSLDFGIVNALGVAPPAGTSTVAASGGTVYSTPYLIQPTFSGSTSPNATVSGWVSTDFVHPSVLVLRDGSSSSGPFTNFSKNSGAPTTITTSATSGVDLTRYLGLFVAVMNGAGGYIGSDNATLTFSLTLP